MIEMILFVLIIGFLGAACGWYAREWYARRIIRLLEKRVHQAVEKASKNAIEVRIEKEGDVYYIYNANTNEFLAQGDNHDDITKILNDRFPNTFFTADRDEIRKMGYKHDAV